MFKKSIAIIITALMFCTGFVYAADDATAAYEVQGTDDAYEFKELIDLINKERLRLGYGILEYDASLLPYAEIRAQECSYYWSHTRPDGQLWNTVDKDNPDGHIYRGENLARNPDGGNDAGVFNAWMNSSIHYKTMTKPAFTKIAVAHYYNSETGYYTWVAGFGID